MLLSFFFNNKCLADCLVTFSKLADGINASELTERLFSKYNRYCFFNTENRLLKHQSYCLKFVYLIAPLNVTKNLTFLVYVELFSGNNIKITCLALRCIRFLFQWHTAEWSSVAFQSDKLDSAVLGSAINCWCTFGFTKLEISEITTAGWNLS